MHSVFGCDFILELVVHFDSDAVVGSRRTSYNRYVELRIIIIIIIIIKRLHYACILALVYIVWSTRVIIGNLIICCLGCCLVANDVS